WRGPRRATKDPARAVAGLGRLGEGEMTTAETGASAPLTSDQVLDELDFLAKVCHAVRVEAQTIQGAAGRSRPADEFGSINDQADGLAQTASSIAVGEMFRLRRLN